MKIKSWLGGAQIFITMQVISSTTPLMLLTYASHLVSASTVISGAVFLFSSRFEISSFEKTSQTPSVATIICLSDLVNS